MEIIESGSAFSSQWFGPRPPLSSLTASRHWRGFDRWLSAVRLQHFLWMRASRQPITTGSQWPRSSPKSPSHHCSIRCEREFLSVEGVCSFSHCVHLLLNASLITGTSLTLRSKSFVFVIALLAEYDAFFSIFLLRWFNILTEMTSTSRRAQFHKRR